jgi:hypothetical protein
MVLVMKLGWKYHANIIIEVGLRTHCGELR